MLTLVCVPRDCMFQLDTVDIGRAGQPGWRARKYDVDVLREENKQIALPCLLNLYVDIQNDT